MKTNIKRVSRITQQGIKVLSVGQNNVAAIKDNSLEYENSIYLRLDAYDKNGKLIATFINGALDIDYF